MAQHKCTIIITKTWSHPSHSLSLSVTYTFVDSPLPTPLPPQLPKCLWFTLIPTESAPQTLPSLYSWAINSSGFFFLSRCVPTMRLCLLLWVQADKALTHITPSSTSHSQSIIPEDREEEGGREGGQRQEERRKTWNSEVSPSSVLLLYPFPSWGDD